MKRNNSVTPGISLKIVGYRRHYGDCYGNDLGHFLQRLSECRKLCDENAQCKAFTFINTDLFLLLKPDWPTDHTCFLKSNCSENTLHRNWTGVYTYFKGLTGTGKYSCFSFWVLKEPKLFFPFVLSARSIYSTIETLSFNAAGNYGEKYELKHVLMVPKTITWPF